MQVTTECVALRRSLQPRLWSSTSTRTNFIQSKRRRYGVPAEITLHCSLQMPEWIIMRFSIDRQEEAVAAVSFKAQTMPAHIFEGPIGIPQKKQLAVTIPQSPCITKPTKHEPAPIVLDNNFKANPMPDFSAVFEPSTYVRVQRPNPAYTRLTSKRRALVTIRAPLTTHCFVEDMWDIE
jgi:hypothetical protein